LKRDGSAIKEESVKNLAEHIIPVVEITENDGFEGMPLRMLRGSFNKISSRMLRQAIVHNLEGKGKKKLYRTRVETERGLEAAVTTKEPNEKIKHAIENMGEKYYGDDWDRLYRFRSKERITAPDTKYDYDVFSGLPGLLMKHADRHDEDLEEWNEDRIRKEEKGVFFWSLKGVDPESKRDERDILYRIYRKNGEIGLETELVLKKRNNCVWSVDPFEADKYMKAVLGSEDDPRRRVLFDRARKGEELAEYAADLIRNDDVEYDESIWKDHFEVYTSYFNLDEVPDFEFGKKKNSKKEPITTDPWLKELDSYVDQMKGGLETGSSVSKTKREFSKDTKTSRLNYREPIQEFLEYVKDAVYGRLKGGYPKE